MSPSAPAKRAPRGRLREGEYYGGGTALGAVMAHGAVEREKACPAERLDDLGGNSIGACLAVMRAAGKAERYRQMWLDEIKGARSFQRVNPAIWNGLFHFGPLRKLIAREVRPADLRCRVWVAMTDLGSKRYERVYLNDLDAGGLVDAVVSSCTQFGVHVAALLNGRKKADGGLRHVQAMPDKPVGRIDRAWFFSCAKASAPFRDNDDLAQDDITIGRTPEILCDTIEANDYRRIQRWVEGGLEAWGVEPAERPGDPFDADPATNEWRVETIGRAAWEARSLIPPRPGLHLAQGELDALRDKLSADGIDLDAYVKAARRAA